MKIELSIEPAKVMIESKTEAPLTPPRSSRTADPVLPLFRLKKILVPVDFSGCSKKALQYAIPFARQFGAELILLHVAQSYPPMPEMGPVDVENLVDAHEQLAALQGTVGNVVPSKTMVRTGSPQGEIIEAAKEFDIDLIVLATHGRRGLEHVLLGSTAEKVVRHAGCPILIVRENEHEFIVNDPAPVE